MGRYVSGLTILFPEGTNKEDSGCHKKEQEKAEEKNNKNKENGSLLPMVIREKDTSSSFQMPLHYPKYTKEDYEDLPESELDLLLASYGFSTHGDLDYKREFAIGAFLWPDFQGEQVESSPSHILQHSSTPKQFSRSGQKKRGARVKAICPDSRGDARELHEVSLHSTPREDRRGLELMELTWIMLVLHSNMSSGVTGITLLRQEPKRTVEEPNIAEPWDLKM
ncbi:unnamed protein product [Dovyalis caffra]|uniref:DUF7722 domain-containing protein n=1 Tax=Dovyalis caffra TaxID=77055 RepID=A0AAV1SMV6_9ROSI|nr:unnamed protein product [Dovyalis caffra]